MKSVMLILINKNSLAPFNHNSIRRSKVFMYDLHYYHKGKKITGH